jgi:4-hydroxybenzoate polyprenyltransferase
MTEAKVYAQPTLLRDFVSLARPRHWLKNVFVLAPLGFAASADRLEALPRVGLAFVVFCLLSSAIYCANDALDADADRMHPTKRNRPVAAGRVSRAQALATAALVALAAFLLSVRLLPWGVTAAAGLYVINNAIYNAWLKNHVIADVMSIALGFVLRLLAGALAIPVDPSSWLLVCGFSLALLLGFGKRRTELATLERGGEYRRALAVYSVPKVDTLLAVCASLTLLSYMLYTVAPDTAQIHGTTRLVYTVPFVVYGIFRFIFKVQEGKGDGPVEILARDWVFTANGLLWAAAVALILLAR